MKEKLEIHRQIEAENRQEQERWKNGQYTLIYWLKNQSKEFSDPQTYVTDDIQKLNQAIANCQIHGYEIEQILGIA